MFRPVCFPVCVCVWQCGKQICRQRTNKLWQQLWRQQRQLKQPRNCKTHCTLNWNQCEIQEVTPPASPLTLLLRIMASCCKLNLFFFSFLAALFLARAFCGWQLTQCSGSGNGRSRICSWKMVKIGENRSRKWRPFCAHLSGNWFWVNATLFKLKCCH